jgi:hypothetical protein
MRKKIYEKNNPNTAGASNSWRKSCKHEPINQLLGLIQWLERKKKIQIKTSQTLPVPAVPRGLQVIRKIKESRAHQSAAGSNLVAREWKKKFQKKTSETLHVPAVPRGFKFIENKLQIQVNPSAAGPNPVAQE